MVRILPLALGVALGPTACDPEPLEVHLELRGDDCTAEDLAEVRVVSVEIYGSAGGEDLCTLARRCVFADAAPTDIDGIATLLHDVNQPLVDAELDGAAYLHVVGRATCWDQPDPVTGVLPTPPACGANDLAEVDGDALAVTMSCGAACAAQQVPLCD